MEARRIEKLLVVDRAGRLTGLLTIKDIEQAVLNSLAVKDEQGRLRVAAASSVGDAGYERSLRSSTPGSTWLSSTPRTGTRAGSPKR